MCGILGGIGHEISRASLHLLAHRGPDGQGLEKILSHGRDVWLGHTRLAILDLSSAGQQPMRSRDGRWWITFNGEIYNHLALRKSLSGYFQGDSDTETLVELLSEYGMQQTLMLLNGMFAFAALDTVDGKLYLVRDPFGIKPLYYAQKNTGLFFSSEARMLRSLGLGDQLEKKGLKQFLTLRYVPSPSTLWRDVRRLPPGHILAADLHSRKHHLKCFISPTRDRFQGSIDDAVAVYREKLSSAVTRQLLSDVPVGILLSGGVDSALVAAMAKDAGNTLPAFSVGFGRGHEECEIADAADTARLLGLPFHQVTVTPDELKEALPAIVGAVEEPLGTTSILPMWELVRRARQDVTVVLTGQGTDEPWGGYFRYQVELLGRWFPWPGGWNIVRQLIQGLPMLPAAAERGLRTLSQSDPAHRIQEASALFPAHERLLLLGEDDDGGASDQIDYWLDWLKPVPAVSGAERMMRLDTRMNLADDLLLYGDKISMAVSLEARVPMLDLELVQFVESLPMAYRVRWRQTKIVHKMMAERYLSPDIVHRPKRGFQIPFGDWSRNQWRSWVQEQLFAGLEGILDIASVNDFWQQHLQKRPDRSRQMFSLLMLALWNLARRHE